MFYYHKGFYRPVCETCGTVPCICPRSVPVIPVAPAVTCVPVVPAVSVAPVLCTPAVATVAPVWATLVSHRRPVPILERDVLESQTPLSIHYPLAPVGHAQFVSRVSLLQAAPASPCHTSYANHNPASPHGHAHAWHCTCPCQNGHHGHSGHNGHNGNGGMGRYHTDATIKPIDYCDGQRHTKSVTFADV